MKPFAKLLRLDFLPRSTDIGLLVLRLWFGLSLALLHGWGKFTDFDSMSQKFMSVFGLSQKFSLGMALFAELICSLLVALGLFTRFAALMVMITMAVAFTTAHKGVLKGPGSGELAFLYLGAYFALFVAGPGRYSVDAKMGGKV